MTTDTTFTNVCLPWATHNYTIFPVLGRPVSGEQRIWHIHIGKWHCSQPYFSFEWRVHDFPGSGNAGFELRL